MSMMTMHRKQSLIRGYLAGVNAVSRPGHGLRQLRARMEASNEERVNLMLRLYLSTASTKAHSISRSSNGV